MYIKQVGRGDEETQIAQMLSTKELLADPRNHCVPVIEVIDDPDDDSKSYMVMPLLRNAADPPFQHVKEIIEFVDQILEVRYARIAVGHTYLTWPCRVWSSCMRRESPIGKKYL